MSEKTTKEIIDKVLCEEENNMNKLNDPKITVYNTEGTVPHLHFKFKDGTEGCVRLDIPKYFCHEKHHKGMNNSQRKKSMRFITAKGNWKNCIEIWNKGRTEFIVTLKTMPNYDLLPQLQPNGELAEGDKQ